jgi:probable F420-dependent oxidoreductase
VRQDGHVDGDGTRRFRFGVVGESIRSPEQLVAEARQAEDLGYSTLLLRDHFQREPFGDQFAPLPALLAAASVTSTLRVGTLVLDNDYRHPVLLAKEAATVDSLSGGRFELGIGAGWLREEYERAGLPFDAPGVRVGRLEESVRILRRLLAGEEVSFGGEHYSVRALRNFPPPASGAPPILIGAGSPRMLRMAGELADIVGILPKALPAGTISAELSERSPETMAQKVGWVREGAGDRLPDVELSIVVTVVPADDHRAAAERLAAERGWNGLPAEQVLQMPSVLIGSPDRIADQLRERRDRFGLSYLVVSDEDMAALAPVVALLAGT